MNPGARIEKREARHYFFFNGWFGAWNQYIKARQNRIVLKQNLNDGQNSITEAETNALDASQLLLPWL